MSDLIKLNCPFCGGKLEIPINSNKVTCLYCGQDSLIPGLVKSQSACPICGEKDQVQKVSGLVLSDPAFAQHLRAPDKPRIPSFDEYLRTQQSSTPITATAQKKKPFGIFLFLALYSFGQAAYLFILVLSLAYSQATDYLQDFNFLPFAIIGFIFFIALGVLFAVLSGRAKRYNASLTSTPLSVAQVPLTKTELIRSNYEAMAQSRMQAWNLAMKKWELLYYCKRDNIVFIPGAADHAPIAGMLAYINAENS
jgi:RNA polymerase subunit RPABC4/transcription elongation factor Spt4